MQQLNNSHGHSISMATGRIHLIFAINLHICIHDIQLTHFHIRYTFITTVVELFIS